ncbi:6,7,8-trihydroxycoumarin synthase-like [Apium graveolens]|uniref:6,7,8-trihydroxycoumarin synthase-like n=1 Tax=Apium graveolens TaxID=4045 RepID=UPI003D7A2BC6
MEIALFLLTISLPILLLFKLKNYYARKSNHRPPGPRGLPLIGNMHQFDSVNTHIYLYKLSQKYGPLMSLQLGSVQTLVISSASAAKEVFKYHDLCFSSRPTLVGSWKLSYNGIEIIFGRYSEYWREMRKITTLHLFSSKRSQSFQPIREQEVARMVKTIRDGAAADSYIVNLSKTLMTLTSSIIFRITFGKGYDDEGAENDNSMSSKFHWLLTETQANFVSFFLTDYFPLMGRLIDRLSGACARLEKSFNALDAFYQQLIDEHIHSSTVSAQDCSILDILLQMKKDSSEITLDHIKAILMNVIVAASDTSAAAVVWAMTLLIKNPSEMKKVQQEVRDLTGKKGFVDENDVQKLVYLKAVVKETMRLNPPVPLLVPRETIEKCVINGYEIEAKTLVYINAYAIGKDPESWENPNEFLPERFINSSIDFKGQDYELIPFGAGRRICPGISMGVATTELALANLLYSFNWELTPGVQLEDIDMATLPGITMHKKNHLNLVAKTIT